ncbi:MAG: leucyl aminopeptidase [Sphingomonadales bacterium 32-68-7]|nr:MAG: leucyl aminopeptidase [Sphingomonadales bacterium 12-68-11]OYX08302.1 MAG: leucyl aminopeptidase [Sphingomonadales bacterium 32-68-7]
MSPLPARAAFAALALGLALPGVGHAQDTVGSGVVPREHGNSAQRPVTFAVRAPEAAALVILTGSAALPDGVPLSAAERRAVEAAIAADGFAGKANAKLKLRGIGSRPVVLLVGTGSEAEGLMEAAGTAAQDLKGEKAPVALVGLASAQAAADAALGYELGQYRFDRYRTGATEAPPAQPVTVVTASATAAQAAFAARHAGLAEGVRFARDLVTEPANVVYPESFVERTRAAFRGIPNVEIEVLDEAAMRALNMGSIVGVGQGSRRGSRLLLVTYKGADGPPLALAGKGITFDSGGISLKPGAGMWEMKADMAGAAAVVGTALSLARTRAPVHVVAVAALAENLPGGNAQRPGDVVRTYGGKTIEVINTDAEGRLVLADALGYVADKRKPFAIVDIATLTGAAVSALGPEYAALFARDDAVAARLAAAGEASGEEVWRLPLHPTYRKAVESPIADVKNSDASPAPGASAGAHFIEAFVAEDMPWAHVDMAPTMWADSAEPLTPKGASGYGVRLLDALAREWKP